MATYLAKRIANGKLSYEEVVRKYPEYKAEIDEILVRNGNGDLIIEVN